MFCLQMQLLCRSSLSAGQTAISAAQKQEEEVLEQAVLERREQFGPPANLFSEPLTEAFSFRPRQSQQSLSQQQSQASPIGFQPRTSIATPQRDTGMHRAMHVPGGSQSQRRGQPMEQGASKSNQNLQMSNQAQNAAPAGFVHFGVEPNGPTE